MTANQMMPPKIITELKQAVRAAHRCEALYINTVHVKTSVAADPKWDGLVMVFELIGHPKARRCYAWTYRDGGELRTVTALEMAPVVSPEIAVSMTSACNDGS